MAQKCDYGCGQISIFQFKNGKHCCSSNSSSCPEIKKKLVQRHKGYDYETLSLETKAKMSRKGIQSHTVEEVFKEDTHWSSEFLRKYIHNNEILDYKCGNTYCGITEWHSNHLVLELDHKNGKRTDNRKENLRWLCPNCHSQTDTFRGRNKNTGKKKVTNEELLTALQVHSNIRQALQSVGLAAKGGNYERASKLWNKQIAPVVKSVDTREDQKARPLHLEIDE